MLYSLNVFSNSQNYVVFSVVTYFLIEISECAYQSYLLQYYSNINKFPLRLNIIYFRQLGKYVVQFCRQHSAENSSVPTSVNREKLTDICTLFKRL